MRDMLVNKDNMYNVENFASKPFKSKNNKFHNGQKDFSNKKKRGPCFVCGKMGHLAQVRKFRKV